MPLSEEEVRKRLSKILTDNDAIQRSAKATFTYFDKDENGYLDINEFRTCVHNLVKTMQLPPVDDSMLYKLMQAYDHDEGGLYLSASEFAQLYTNLMFSIRDKYFPEKRLLVDRAKFVSHQIITSGQSIKDYFSFEKRLGSGSFGEVFSVIDSSSKQDRVCKVINKDRTDLPMEQISSEIAIMKKLDHPNIIKIFEVYEDKENMYLIMETCRGGELLERMMNRRSKGHQFQEKEMAEMMQQILQSVAYCHERHIVHKDLKPENIMFLNQEDNSMKVIDFGVAEMFGKGLDYSTRAAGTAVYMAPEVFNFKVCLKSDVWSAGVILYVLLTGKLPFTGRTLLELKLKIQQIQPLYASDCKGSSSSALDLLKKMLCKTPQKRPTAVEALRHPWFTQARTESINMMAEVQDNLHEYVKENGLKRAMCNVLAHQLNVNGPQVRVIIQLFRSLDKDGNGVLSRKEITAGLEQQGWQAYDIYRLLAAMDTTGDDLVYYNEFLAACYRWQEKEVNIVWGAFQKMDKDNDSKISAEDLMELVSSDEQHMLSPKEVQKLIDEVDKDGSNGIEWDEFKSWMLR